MGFYYGKDNLMKKSIFLVASLFSLGCLIGCESKKTPSVTLSSIAVSGQQTTFNVGDSFVFGGTVTATYSDQTTKDVTADTKFAGYDMNTASTQTVTASYTEKKVTQTTTYSIRVNGSTPPGPQEPVFTAFVDGRELTDFAKTTADPNMLYQYKAVLDVTAGQTFTFKMDNTSISVSASTGENNLVDSATGLSVHNNASQASLYFKVYGVYNPEELDTLHFEAWLSGYESTPGPQTVPYKAFNESTEIELKSMDPEGDMIEQYESKETLTVKEFNLFTFTLDGQKLDVHASSGDNNLVYNEDGELKVHNDAEDVKLYFKVYNDQSHEGQKWYEAYLGGYVAEVIPAKEPKTYLHITLDSTVDEPVWRDVEIALKNGSETEYMSEEMHLDNKAQLVVKHVDTLGTEHWYNYDDVKGGCLDLVERSPEVVGADGSTHSDNNIVVKEEGDYTFYFDTVADEKGGRIWISKKAAPVEEPVYQAFNESTEIELEPCDLGEDMVAQFKSKEKLSVKQNNLFTFKADDKLIRVHASKVVDNNLRENEDGELKVRNDAEDVELYFKVYNDQAKPGEYWYEAYLGGYEEPPVLEPKAYLHLALDGETFEDIEIFIPEEAENQHEYVSKEIELTEQSQVAIKYVDKDGQAHWYHYSDVKNGCKSLVKASPAYEHENGETYSDDNIMVNKATGYTFYFDTQASEDGQIWIREREVEPVATLNYSQDNGETWTDIKMTLKEGSKTEYVYKGLELKENDQVFIKYLDKHENASYGHYSDVKSGCISLVEKSPEYEHKDGNTYSDDNMLIKADGEYNFYYDLEGDEQGKRIWISQPEPEVIYTLKVGSGEAIPMKDVSEKKSESDTWVKQFKAEKVNLVQNETLTFFANEEQIYPGAGNNSKNNVVYDNDSESLTIRTTAEGDVYLKLYEDGGFDTWVEGYEEPVVQQGPTVYFTLPNGWNNLKIYYWGGEHPSTWPGVEMQFVEYNQYRQAVYSFTLPKDATEFLFVNYNSENDHPKTRDISVSEITEEANQFYLDNEGNLQVTLYTPQA